MSHKESIKTAAVVLLFCCMVTLAALYIVNTQRLTVNGDPAVDINRLLIIRSGGGELTEYDRSLVMPEAVCIGNSGNMYGCLSDSGTLYDIYSVVSKPLAELLGPSSKAEICGDDEGSALWQKCLDSENFIYIKYHTPLPSPIIYAGLKGGTVSTPPEYASGEPSNIREMFIILENSNGNSYEYYAAARDGDGRIVRYELADRRGNYFDISEISAFASNRNFVNCSFADDNADDLYSPLVFKDTAIITDAQLQSQLITVSEAMTDGISDRLLRFFGFNPDRLNTYRESGGAAVYVETGATLRHSTGSLHYAVTDAGKGLDVSELLGYENYSGDYNVYELLCASGELIRRIKSIDHMLCGGDAAMLLSDIHYSDGSITVGFGLTWNGVMLYGTDYSPIRSLEVTFDGGRITDVTVSSAAITGAASAIVSFPQSFTMNGLRTRISEDAIADGIPGDIRLAYIIASEFSSNAAFSSDWLYVW